MKKQTTKTTVKKTNIKNATASASYIVGSHNGQIFAQVPYTVDDFKNALLIVSLSVNVFLLALWLSTQVSQDYAVAIAQLIAG